MQLHPAIDTDAGSIAASDGEGSFTHAHLQRFVPAAEAAQSSRQACSSSDEAGTDRRSGPNQLHDREDGVRFGQMDQSDRQMSQTERPRGQPERQSRSSGGPSHRQHKAMSGSETSILSKRSSTRLSNQQQHSAFRGVDATDHCSACDNAGLISHSVVQSHSTQGSSSARPDGKSATAGMQETQFGQADSSLSPLKVCFRVAARDSPPSHKCAVITCCHSPCPLSSCAHCVMLHSAMWHCS